MAVGLRGPIVAEDGGVCAPADSAAADSAVVVADGAAADSEVAEAFGASARRSTMAGGNNGRFRRIGYVPHSSGSQT